MSETDKRQAVVYCRIASVTQGKKAEAFQAQLTHCEEFARVNDFAVIATFKDHAPGNMIDRPAVTSMLNFLREQPKGGVTVLVDSPSRIARDLQGYMDLRLAVQNAGGTFRLALDETTLGDNSPVEGVTFDFAQRSHQMHAAQRSLK